MGVLWEWGVERICYLRPTFVFVKTQQNYLNVLEDVFWGLMACVLSTFRFS